MEGMEDIMKQLNELKLEDDPNNPEADLTEKLAGLSVDDSPFEKGTQEIIQKISTCEGSKEVVGCLVNIDLTCLPCKELCILYTIEDEKLALITLIGSCQLLTKQDPPLAKMTDWNLINLLLNLLDKSEDTSVKIEITKAFSILFKNNECALEMMLMDGFCPPVIKNCTVEELELQEVSLKILYWISCQDERYIKCLIEVGCLDMALELGWKVERDSDFQRKVTQILKKLIVGTEEYTREQANQIIDDLGRCLVDVTDEEIITNIIACLLDVLSHEYDYNICMKFHLQPTLELIHTNLEAQYEGEGEANELQENIDNIISEMTNRDSEEISIIQEGFLSDAEKVFDSGNEDEKRKFIRLISLYILDSEQAVAELGPGFNAILGNYSAFSEDLLVFMVEGVHMMLEKLSLEVINQYITIDLPQFLLDTTMTFISSRRTLTKCKANLQKYCQFFSESHNSDHQIYTLLNNFLSCLPSQPQNKAQIAENSSAGLSEGKLLLDYLKS